MNLYIDVGNTHTVFGVKSGDSFKKWRLSTSRYETEDEVFSHLSTLLDNEGLDHRFVDGIVISSVVPSLNRILRRLSEKFFKVEPLFVVADDSCGVKWPVRDPKAIGADRVSNVIGAVHEYSEDVLVLDFGTAITIDVVKNSEFLGGTISPGIMTMLYSLFNNAAKLPLIDLSIVPESSIGRNTEDNIRIGILKLVAYGLNRIMEDIEKELDYNPVVVVTGGQSELVLDILRYDVYDPDMTLKGMEWYKKLHVV